MSDGLAVAAYGMEMDARRLSVIAHNIANSTTPAFKKEIVVGRAFADYLGVAAAAGGGATPLAATSLPEVRSVIDFSQGTQRHTGNPLDVAIEGDGFFELRDGQGTATYTRQGNFRLDQTGRLVSEAGIPVAGSAGEITLTTSQPSIDGRGRIFEAGKQVAELRVVRIGDPTTLQALGAGLYAATEATTVNTDGGARVRQNFLESSNVVTMHEMVRMIETMRHFEASQKVMQAYDGILDKAISKLGEF